MKNDNVKAFVVLVLICVAVAALMGIVNYATEPIIKDIEIQKTNASLNTVMPDGGSFEKLAVAGLPSTVKEAYSAKNGGYVFKLVTNGYGTGLTIICGIDENGNVIGCECIQSNETLGKEKTYGESLVGKNNSDIEAADTVSGATLTTRAYKKAITDALKAFETIKEAK